MSRLVLRPIGDGLLGAVVAAYQDADIPLPERRTVAPGAPGQIAWDCEQVVVALASINPGGTGGAVNLLPQQGSPAGMGLIRLATWSVQVVRCTPLGSDDGQPPEVAALSEAAQLALDDAGVLSQCMTAVASAQPGTLSWIPIGSTINAGTVAALGPEGGFHGTEATVSLSVLGAV